MTAPGDAIDPGGAGGGFGVYWDKPLGVPGSFSTIAPLPGPVQRGRRRWRRPAGRSTGSAAASSARRSRRRLLEEAATTPPGAGGVLFLPYLAGERSPLWDPSARGAFVGSDARPWPRPSRPGDRRGVRARDPPRRRADPRRRRHGRGDAGLRRPGPERDVEPGEGRRDGLLGRGAGGPRDGCRRGGDPRGGGDRRLRRRLGGDPRDDPRRPPARTASRARDLYDAPYEAYSKLHPAIAPIVRRHGAAHDRGAAGWSPTTSPSGSAGRAGPRRASTGSISASSAARSSRSSVRTAAARARSCVSSPGCSTRSAARVALDDEPIDGPDPRDRPGLPGAAPAAVAIGRRQRRLPARARRLAARRRAERLGELLGLVGLSGVGRRPAGPAVRRDAPAGGDRPGPRPRARGAPARRAVQRARRPDPRALQPGAARAVGADRDDDRHRDPQHPRGDPARRPGRRHDAAAPAASPRSSRSTPRGRARSSRSTPPSCREPRAEIRAHSSGRGGGMSSRPPSRSVAISFAVFVAAWKLVVVVGGYPPFILPPPEAVVGSASSTAWADGMIGPTALRRSSRSALGFAVGAATRARRRLRPRPVARSSSGSSRRTSSPPRRRRSSPLPRSSPCGSGPGLIEQGRHLRRSSCSSRSRSRRWSGSAPSTRGLLELARSLRATRRQVLTTLEIPAALPSILGGMRVGVTLAVVGAIVGEWAGAERGLGVLINLARGSLFDIPLMFATLVTIALHRHRPLSRRRPRRAPPRRRSLARSRRYRVIDRPSAPGRGRHRPDRRPDRRVGHRARRRFGPGVGEPSVAPSASVGPSGSPRVRLAGRRVADGRPRLHPERPVRPVLPGRAGRLLRGRGSRR